MMQQILREMITKNNKLLSKTVSICSRNIQYLGGFLDLLSSLGTLENVVTFLTNLLLISSRMLEKDPDSIEIEPFVVDKFVTSMVDKVKGTSESSQAILKKNLTLQNADIFNERAFSAVLKFSIYSLQTINLLGVEKLIDINNLEESKSIVSTVLSFHSNMFRTTLNVHKMFNKFSKTNSFRENYAELAKKYYRVLTLFFWWASGIGE